MICIIGAPLLATVEGSIYRPWQWPFFSAYHAHLSAPQTGTTQTSHKSGHEALHLILAGASRSNPVKSLPRPPRRALGTPQWFGHCVRRRSFPQTATYVFPAPRPQSLNRHVLLRQDEMPRHYAFCLVECNRQKSASWTISQCRACRCYCLEPGPSMNVIPCAPSHSPH